MDSGFYAACTALMARSQTLDLVANNLANVSTPGYRAQHDSFSSLLATSSGASLSGLNQAVNDYSVLGGGQLDLSQGNLEKTGNELDLGIEGQGFFSVQTANGQVYTRDGNFHVSPKGQLVTSAGDPVLGTDNRPLPIVGAPVSVSPDGTISVNGALAGQLKIVDFKDPNALGKIGNSYFSGSPDNPPLPATGVSVDQGRIEGSNVAPAESAVRLVGVMRQFEMLQKAISLTTDMDKKSLDDVARVPSNA